MLMQGGETEDEFLMSRQQMLKYDISGRGISDAVLLEVMADIPREIFVPGRYKWQAYSDGPLPIGSGQTISQPYIVALMTEYLRLDKDKKVLEIGTGSGYQTAVLARLSKKVYTVERVAELSESARRVLRELGIENVRFHIGDGSCGWPEAMIFDRIMVTAAVPSLPRPLLGQLADGGIIVAPVGRRWVQELVVCEKTGGQVSKKRVCDVQFVKLFGKYGFEERGNQNFTNER